MPIVFCINRSLLLGLLVLASGCAGSRGADDPSYVYRAGDDYVRLVPAETGAPPNAHPFAVSADQLARLLADLDVQGAASRGTRKLFTKEELDRIASPLAEALSKATPRQDVTFAVSAQSGILRSFGSASITSGRLFARDRSLNLIFGAVQELKESPATTFTGTPSLDPGKRAPRHAPTVWEIKPGRGQFHERRGDWLVFDASVLRATPRTDVLPERPASPPTVDGKEQEIENRLRALERLREKGVITEQEYVERRREILREL